MRKPWMALCLCFIFCMAVPAVAQEVRVKAFNTYLNPPFRNEDGSGLAQALVDYLNRKLKGEFHFDLEHIPRERLVQVELSKEARFSGIALLLAPPFVDDPARSRFLWSAPIFEDYNLLVFAGMRPPAIKALKDLRGMRFASILGNRYSGLDDMVANGALTEERTTSELANLQKVAVDRADFTQMNRLLFFTMAARPEFAGRISAIAEPEAAPFQRSILVGKASFRVLPAVNRALKEISDDTVWRKLDQDLGLQLLSQE